MYVQYVHPPCRQQDAGCRMQDAGSREGCMATSQTMMDDGMRDERCAWKGEGGEGGREGGRGYL